MEPGNAILVGAVLATVGWIYNGRLQLRSTRRKHTYEIIKSELGDKTYAKRLEEIRKLLNSDAFDTGAGAEPFQEVSSLDEMLNYYEFLAASIWCGDVDEELMLRFHKSRVIKLFELSAGYIEANRSVDEQPTLWSDFETLAKRWRGDTKPLPFQRLIERIAMRPCNPAR